MSATGQNRSTAVMQRRVEAHDSLDDFPTPNFATRAVLEWMQAENMVHPTHVVREPCANRGHMVRPLAEYFNAVIAADIHDYGFGYPVEDYLFGPDQAKVDWTFMNPPFRLAQQFIERGLRTSIHGVAVIVRSAFLEGGGRYASLFSHTPPSYVLQHVERVAMVKGRYDPAAASATAYSWLIWHHGHGDDTRLRWLPPCKARLARADDVIEAAA